jgi:hypothetical protein
MSDIEIALLLATHIENPCSVEVNGKIENLRAFYIREARENVLPKLTNPFAREYLEKIISEYKRE